MSFWAGELYFMKTLLKSLNYVFKFFPSFYPLCSNTCPNYYYIKLYYMSLVLKTSTIQQNFNNFWLCIENQKHNDIYRKIVYSFLNHDRFLSITDGIFLFLLVRFRSQSAQCACIPILKGYMCLFMKFKSTNQTTFFHKPTYITKINFRFNNIFCLQKALRYNKINFNSKRI